jgi:NAD(P)H dehydrogenase (quinone)
MKIGVTGATGQLGRLVVEKLKSKVPAGNITALVRDPQKAAALGVGSREFNYAGSNDLASALEGIDTLLLISGNEIGQRFAQHSNVIAAAKKAGVNWIIYTSLLRADTSTLSLAGEHLETEKALKASGISFTILRNGWYTENYAGSMKSAVAAGVLTGSSGNGKISSAARADYADAAVAVLTGTGHAGKTYELAGDSAYTLSELAAELSKQSGKTINYNNLPENEYAAMLKSFGVPEGFAHVVAGWDTSVSKGDLYDNSRQLSKLIGRPTTSFAVTVKDTLANS